MIGLGGRYFRVSGNPASASFNVSHQNVKSVVNPYIRCPFVEMVYCLRLEKPNLVALFICLANFVSRGTLICVDHDEMFHVKQSPDRLPYFSFS